MKQKEIANRLKSERSQIDGKLNEYETKGLYRGL